MWLPVFRILAHLFYFSIVLLVRKESLLKVDSRTELPCTLLFFCCSSVPWTPTLDRASLYLSVAQLLFQLLFFRCSNVPRAPTVDRASQYLSVVHCFSVSVLHQQYVCELLSLVQGECQQQGFDYQCTMDPHNGQSFSVPFCCPVVIPIVVFLLFQCTMGPHNGQSFTISFCCPCFSASSTISL